MAHDKRARNKQREQFRLQRQQSETWQMRDGSRWPITSCLVVGDWQSEGALLQVILTRTHHPEDSRSRVAWGVYLVDLGCLGVKNTYGRITIPEERAALLERMPLEGSGLVETDPGVALMILQAAVDYARSLGFEPHADFRKTAALWAGVTPAPLDERLVLGGTEGKPLYVSGPHDDAHAIVAQLDRRVGPSGFHYIMGGPL